MILLEKIKSIFGFRSENTSISKIMDSNLIEFKEGKIIINSDVEISIKGNLKILTDEHIVLQTSKEKSNDEYDVFSIHLQPDKDSSVFIRNKDHE